MGGRGEGGGEGVGKGVSEESPRVVAAVVEMAEGVGGEGAGGWSSGSSRGGGGGGGGSGGAVGGGVLREGTRSGIEEHKASDVSLTTSGSSPGAAVGVVMMPVSCLAVSWGGGPVVLLYEVPLLGDHRGPVGGG